MPGRRWSTREVDRLKQLWAADRLSIQTIADVLGRTKPSCAQQALRLGLKKRRANSPLEGRKVCTKCGQDKPLSEYYAKAHSYSGRHSRCKECIRAYALRYYYGKRRHEA